MKLNEAPKTEKLIRRLKGEVRATSWWIRAPEHNPKVPDEKVVHLIEIIFGLKPLGEPDQLNNYQKLISELGGSDISKEVLLAIKYLKSVGVPYLTNECFPLNMYKMLKQRLFPYDVPDHISKEGNSIVSSLEYIDALAFYRVLINGAPKRLISPPELRGNTNGYFVALYLLHQIAAGIIDAEERGVYEVVENKWGEL